MITNHHKRIVAAVVCIVALAGLANIVQPGTPAVMTRGIGQTRVVASALVPTDPITFSDNASVLAVADSGSGTAADPFIIENRSFQLNYSYSGIIGLATSCYITIRNCYFNASDPSGIGIAALTTTSGAWVVDNCTFMDCGISGLGFLGAPNCRATNLILVNNSGMLLDTVDNFHAENITMIESAIALLDLGILTHGVSHNLTFKNVNAYESGTELVLGLDLIVTDVDGLLLENWTIDCDVDTCGTYIFNSSNVVIDGFIREAPEVGLGCFNVTNLLIKNSLFEMEENSSLYLDYCENIRLQNSTFINNGTETMNIIGINCTGIVIEDCVLSGGNNTMELQDSTDSMFDNVTFNGNISVSNSLNTTMTNMTFIDSLLASGVTMENVTGLSFNSSEIQCAGNNFTMNDCSGWIIDDCLLNFTGCAMNFSGYMDDIKVINSLIIVDNTTTLGGSLDGYNDINFTHNAYSPYFRSYPELDDAYYVEGDILPEPMAFFDIFNDTTAFYSEYLFGLRVNIVPVPDFVANTTTILEGDWVMFNFTGVSGNGPCTFTWDFGDNSSLLGENVSHQYVTFGTYFVCLNVTDSDGQSAIMNKTAYITVGPSIFADFYVQGFPREFDTGVHYSFIFDGVSGLLPSTYSWDFGDGVLSSGKDVGHNFLRAGSYTVTLVVTDSVGHTDSYSKVIVVRDMAGPSPPGPEPPVIVPLSAGWEGLLFGGLVIVGVGIALIFVGRTRSTRTRARGGSKARARR